MPTRELMMTSKTVLSPVSMRLAISTSPSRVSRETEPILRRYMRTGSLDFDISLSSSADGGTDGKSVLRGGGSVSRERFGGWLARVAATPARLRPQPRCCAG